MHTTPTSMIHNVSNSVPDTAATLLASNTSKSQLLSKERRQRAGPWVDEDRSHSQPLPPVSEQDDRPAVRDLIQDHLAKIDEVRSDLMDDPLYDSIKHDDLWILRFLLSSRKNVKKATAAARGALLYRNAKNLDDRDIRAGWPGRSCEGEASVATYMDCIGEGGLVFSLPHFNREIVGWVGFAAFDQNRLVEELTREEWPFWYFAEWTFQVADSITRRTGRLTKSVRIVDLEGLRRSNCNRECLTRDADASMEFEDFYPQVLRAMYIINAPSFVTAMFRLFRPLVPKRFVEKFNFIDPTRNPKDVKLLLKHMSIDHIPKKYGGTLEGGTYPNQIIISE